MLTRITRASLVLCLFAGFAASCQTAEAYESLWSKRISYQSKNDLFANYQVGSNPSGSAAQMYVSPLPVPAHVGHTYTTYQPWMPHEYMYKHTRSHYAHEQGSGWSRAKVRYRTRGLILQNMIHHSIPGL